MRAFGSEKFSALVPTEGFRIKEARVEGVRRVCRYLCRSIRGWCNCRTCRRASGCCVVVASGPALDSCRQLSSQSRLHKYCVSSLASQRSFQLAPRGGEEYGFASQFSKMAVVQIKRPRMTMLSRRPRKKTKNEQLKSPGNAKRPR